MFKKFEEPVVEVNALDVNDVITASSDPVQPGGNGNFGGGEF